MEDLWRVVRSMQEAAHAAGVSIVTGDTKVVERGKGDGVFINTTALHALRSIILVPLTLGIGRGFTGSLQTWFLALFLAWITG